MTNILRDMLLIEDHSIVRLYKEMNEIARYFIPPFFMIALILEYFGNWRFGDVVVKLLIIVLFMGAFYDFHTKAVDLSLTSASETLMRVSPRNLFVKKWYQAKIETRDDKSWGIISSFAIPNLNDLVATTFFVLSKIFIWILKLIYSTVFHLTYVFSGVTAVLFFFGWTKDAMKGTVQAMLWTIVMPFIVVAILVLVGNSIEETTTNGGLIIAKMDTIVWLFGITVLLLISPLIGYSMIKGDGISAFGSTVVNTMMLTANRGKSIYGSVAKSADRIQKSTKGFRQAQNSSFISRDGASKSESFSSRDNNSAQSNNFDKSEKKESSNRSYQDTTSFKENGSRHTQSEKRSGPEFTKIKEGQSKKEQSSLIRNESRREQQSEKLATNKKEQTRSEKGQTREIKEERTKEQVKQKQPRRSEHELR